VELGLLPGLDGMPTEGGREDDLARGTVIEQWSSVSETIITETSIKRPPGATWLKKIFGIGPEHGDTPAVRLIYPLSYFGVTWLATTGY
jgi:hypothetical protein